MAFLRAGIFGNLQLLGRYFYPIAQTDLEGNTQALKKNPSGKHGKVEKVMTTPRPKAPVRGKPIAETQSLRFAWRSANVRLEQAPLGRGVVITFSTFPCLPDDFFQQLRIALKIGLSYWIEISP